MRIKTKKIAALAISLTMLTVMFSGCSSNKKTETPPIKENPSDMPNEENTTPGISEMPDATGDMLLKDGTKLEDIVVKLGEELGIAMPEKLDDTTLKDAMGINREDVEEYYGEYSVVNVSSDHIIAVKAKKGKSEAVKMALEERKKSVEKNFEQYLVDQLDKAKAGKVIQKGDYLFLVIAGDVEKGADKEIQRAEEIIDSYFVK